MVEVGQCGIDIVDFVGASEQPELDYQGVRQARFGERVAQSVLVRSWLGSFWSHHQQPLWWRGRWRWRRGRWRLQRQRWRLQLW